jgi:hypothetical protein
MAEESKKYTTFVNRNYEAYKKLFPKKYGDMTKDQFAVAMEKQTKKGRKQLLDAVTFLGVPGAFKLAGLGLKVAPKVLNTLKKLKPVAKKAPTGGAKLKPISQITNVLKKEIQKKSPAQITDKTKDAAKKLLPKGEIDKLFAQVTGRVRTKPKVKVPVSQVAPKPKGTTVATTGGRSVTKATGKAVTKTTGRNVARTKPKKDVIIEGTFRTAAKKLPKNQRLLLTNKIKSGKKLTSADKALLAGVTGLTGTAALNKFLKSATKDAGAGVGKPKSGATPFTIKPKPKAKPKQMTQKEAAENRKRILQTSRKKPMVGLTQKEAAEKRKKLAGSAVAGTGGRGSLPKGVLRKYTGKHNSKTEKIRTIGGKSYVVPKGMK